MSVLSGKDSSILECFRPRGKIVCVGESLSSELQIIQDFINVKGKARLPLLLLTALIALYNNGLDRDPTGQVILFGIFGVLLAVYIVKSLPLNLLTWLVICVIFITALTLARAGLKGAR